MSKKAPRDLREAVTDPGFSPSVRHVPALAELAADSERGEDVERALARLGGALAPALAAIMEGAAPAARIRLLRAIGRTGDASEPARALLCAALAGSDERSRRAAEAALGKVGLRASAAERCDIEAALVDAFPRATSDTERRVLAEAIGKVGSARGEALLANVGTGDPNLTRAVSRARLVVARTERRREASGIRPNDAPPGPLAVAFVCRRGLEHIVMEELGPGWDPRLDPHARGFGRVLATLRGSLASAWASRAAERFALVLPDEELRRGADLAETVTRVLLAAEPTLASLTDGPIRFRVSWQGGGHRRAVVWKIAEAISRASTRLVNDPAGSLWELEVGFDERGGRPRPAPAGARRAMAGAPERLSFALRPRGLQDPRFSYRTGDVPAASHPTIAAALARVAFAGGGESDVVWDPFVGSGLELIERQRLGPTARLFGTDIEASALDVARSNLASAGVVAELVKADALSFFPEGATVIVTNPPMGRRVHRQADIGELLVRFVEHVARRLPRGGRLVWLSPQATRTNEAGVRSGMRVERLALVDVGGFEAELQRMTRE